MVKPDPIEHDLYRKEGTMENLIYAFGSSHAPQLAMPPETWELRADVDRRRNRRV